MPKPATIAYDSTNPLAPNMVAWLMYNDSPGDENVLFDSSGNAYHVFLPGDTTQEVSDFGYSLFFDTDVTNDAGFFKSTSASGSSWWFAFWLKPDTQPFSPAVIVEGVSEERFCISGTKFNFIVATNNHFSTADVAFDTWQHILVTCNSGTISLYIDGVFDNSFASGLSSFHPFYYGSSSFSDAAYRGWIDSILYSKDESLNSTQAADLFADHWSGFHLPIPEKPTAIVYDATHPLAPEMAWLMLETELEQENQELLDSTGNEHIGDTFSGILYNFGDNGIFLNTGSGIEPEIINADFDSTTTFWFAFWLNPAPQYHSEATIIESQDYIGFGINGTKFDFFDLLNADHNLSTANVAINTWQHILVSSNAGTVSLYINGELDSTNVTAITHFEPHHYGQGTTGTTGYRGYLDSVYFTPDAFLTEAQAADLYYDHWASFRGVIVEDLLSITDDISKSHTKEFTDTLSITDHEAINLPDNSRSDSLTISDSIIKHYHYGRTISDSLSITEDIDYIYDRWEYIYEKLFKDNLMISESIFFTRISQISFDDDLSLGDTYPLVLNYFTTVNIPNTIGILNNDTIAM